VNRRAISGIQLVSKMEESTAPNSNSGSVWRYFRRFWLTIGLIALSTLVYVITDQMRNDILLINNTGAPANFDLTTFKQARHVDGKVSDWVSILEARIVAPESRVRQSFPSNRMTMVSTRQTVVYGNVDINFSAMLKLSTWGNRVSFVENPGKEQSVAYDKSTLRNWVDANRNWIPLPVRWLE
jgi:hypothetical protein